MAGRRTILCACPRRRSPCCARGRPASRTCTCGSWPMTELSAIAAIATRDLFKFLRDRSRVVLAFLVPFLLLFLLGSTVQLNLGRAAGFNFLGFTFTGVLGLTIFQSSVQGIASLLEDRQNDFAQEVFVSPVSRYSIVFGK